MKKSLFILSATIIVMGLFSSPMLIAQNTSPFWSLAGNSNAVPSSKLGTTNNISLRFYTNNVQRMIINSAAGLVGIGTASPNSRLHVNSAAGENPFRVQVGGSTKFLVHSVGGVSIGGFLAPPANGLYVAGNAGIGTSNPLSRFHVVGDQTLNGTLQYTNPTSASTAMINLFQTGIQNLNRMVIGHSPTFPSWGLQYRDDIDQFDFLGAGISKMAINLANGNVGIGTTLPAYKLSVTAAPATATPVAFIENTSGVHPSDGLYIKAGSNTVAGSWFIAFRRHSGLQNGAIVQSPVTGVVYATTSDKRLKNIIGASQKGLSDLMKINIYDYTFKSDPKKKVQTGFMAQELYEVFPQSVSKPRENNEPAEKNPWMVDYGSITPLIIKSVQEQQQMIDELKKSNDDLKKQNENLEERILKLEAALQYLTEKGNSTITNASLEQNKPNPFNKSTTIRYSIPQGSKGQINIYDPAGKLVKAFKANENGRSELSGYDLAAGTYTYTLMVNGKAALSKQMLIMR